jgi:hypothetical protein
MLTVIRTGEKQAAVIGHLRFAAVTALSGT